MEERFKVTKRAGIYGMIGNIFLLLIKAVVGFASGKHQIINDKSIEILFGKEGDFNEKFEFIHNRPVVIQEEVEDVKSNSF